MMKIKDSKSLTEVWEWKEKVYNKIIKNNKNNSDILEKEAEEVINRLGLIKVTIIKK